MRARAGILTGAILGAMFGAGLAVVAQQAYRTVDAGISRSYRCDQLAREADARATAGALLQGLLLGQTEAEVQALAMAAAVPLQRFEEVDHLILLAGATPATASLSIRLEAGRVVAVLPLPGSPACQPAAP